MKQINAAAPEDDALYCWPMNRSSVVSDLPRSLGLADALAIVVGIAA